MSTQGRFKIASRNRAFEDHLDPRVQTARRVDRIVQSIRQEILEGETECLRIRQIFKEPRAIYRLEFERPEMGYQRTTLLDREALEELLGSEEVRALVRPSDLRSIH
ncbi:MAG: hypothetical protein JSU66_11735 [Deltaproteobacteria bacterium]|nr:MAG: hypothetical protein JSU66_11735 [Deltaproteobacteria bacterium]